MKGRIKRRKKSALFGDTKAVAAVGVAIVSAGLGYLAHRLSGRSRQEMFPEYDSVVDAALSEGEQKSEYFRGKADCFQNLAELTDRNKSFSEYEAEVKDMAEWLRKEECASGNLPDYRDRRSEAKSIEDHVQGTYGGEAVGIASKEVYFKMIYTRGVIDAFQDFEDIRSRYEKKP